MTEGQDKRSKKTTGLVFIKENVVTDKFYHEKVDNSITRTEKEFLKLFKDAGFEVIYNEE